MALIADTIESKDKAHAIELVNGLEAVLYAQGGVQGASSEAFEEIRDTRSYLTDRSSSVKMLLEHLSVILPVIT